MDILDTHRKELAGVDKFYRDEILPDLIAKDMLRRNLVKKFYTVIGIVIPIAILAAFFGFHHFQSPMAVMVPGVIALVIIGIAYAKFGELKANSKFGIVGKLCDFLGWKFTPKGFSVLPSEPFLACHLLPRSERQTYEDCIHGKIKGTDFILHEAHLQKKQRSGKTDTWVTVFRGVMIRLAFPREFLGTTLLLRDAGFLNTKKKSGLKRVGLVDPVFEKIFEAYGSDQVEARYLLTPTFMQKLVDLQRLLDGNKLKAAFTGGHLLITVQAPDQFEIGSMFTSLTDITRTQKVVDEIATVLDIVEIVNQR